MKSTWPHAPPPQLDERGAYIVTAGTYKKEHFFKSDDQLSALQAGLLKYARKYHWQLQAWAVFPNHYHFIGVSSQGMASNNLSKFIEHFHARSAAWLNDVEGAPGRKVWHNYYETHLTYQASYFARLAYVHRNAVKHGIVKLPNQYRWCSAGWFEQSMPASFVQTVYGFNIDRVELVDDF
ncbi:MAG: transposase [Puniceicoccales bacterium]